MNVKTYPTLNVAKLIKRDNMVCSENGYSTGLFEPINYCYRTYSPNIKMKLKFMYIYNFDSECPKHYLRVFHVYWEACSR